MKLSMKSNYTIYKHWPIENINYLLLTFFVIILLIEIKALYNAYKKIEIIIPKQLKNVFPHRKFLNPIVESDNEIFKTCFNIKTDIYHIYTRGVSNFSDTLCAPSWQNLAHAIVILQQLEVPKRVSENKHCRTRFLKITKSLVFRTPLIESEAPYCIIYKCTFIRRNLIVCFFFGLSVTFKNKRRF